MYCDGYKNEIPTKNDEDYRVVDNPGEISNRELMKAFIKVVDRIQVIDVFA